MTDKVHYQGELHQRDLNRVSLLRHELNVAGKELFNVGYRCGFEHGQLSVLNMEAPPTNPDDVFGPITHPIFDGGSQ
jgi:hypothetical protein